MKQKILNNLPIFVRQQKLLLLGAGNVAYEKYQIFRNCAIELKVISREVNSLMLKLMREDGANFEQRAYQMQDLKDFDLIVCALNDPKENEKIYRYGLKHKKLINCVDDAKLCNFIFPAMIKTSGIEIAFSTAGKSPVLASWIRSKILQALPQNLAQISEQIFSQRAYVKQKLIEKIKNKNPFSLQVDFWHQLLNRYATNYSSNKNDSPWDIDQEIKNYANDEQKAKVYLIGAGAGKSDYLSLKAAQILAKADIVFYDHLVDDSILAHIRKGAQKINVGKRGGQISTKQESIHQLLIKSAKSKQTIVRLKGGDPLIFARGGEEIQVLKNEGIEVEIISGISAVQIAASRGQFALTHRDYAKALQLHSLHDIEYKSDSFWQSLVNCEDTFVFYMGARKINFLVKKLLALGADQNLGIAIIENAGLNNEQIFASELKNILQILPENLNTPSLIMLGYTINDSLLNTKAKTPPKQFEELEVKGLN